MLNAEKDKETKTNENITSSFAEDAGPGEDASSLGPGAPVGGAGGPSNAGDGAGAPCFLLCFPFFGLLGAGAGATGVVVGAATGGELAGGVVGAGAGGDLAGGELTGTGAGGELTGTGAGGELTGVAAGGDDAGGFVAGAGSATLDGDTAGDVAALGDEAGGADLGEATGAGLEGVPAAGDEAGVVTAGVAGEVVGAADGDWPPTPATTMQINARESTLLRSIFVIWKVESGNHTVGERESERGYVLKKCDERAYIGPFLVGSP